MPSPAGEEPRQPGGLDLVTVAEMPDRMEKSQLKRLTTERIRQLALADPDWPKPVMKKGRSNLYDWPDVERYFRSRKSRQGQRLSRAVQPPAENPPR